MVYCRFGIYELQWNANENRYNLPRENSFENINLFIFCCGRRKVRVMSKFSNLILRLRVFITSKYGISGRICTRLSGVVILIIWTKDGLECWLIHESLSFYLSIHTYWTGVGSFQTIMYALYNNKTFEMHILHTFSEHANLNQQCRCRLINHNTSFVLKPWHWILITLC